MGVWNHHKRNPQKEHFVSTAADVDGKSDAGTSSRTFLDSGTAAMTDVPEDVENSSEFFCAESKALAWSNMVGRSNVRFSSKRCRIRDECRPEMNECVSYSLLSVLFSSNILKIIFFVQCPQSLQKFFQTLTCLLTTSS